MQKHLIKSTKYFQTLLYSNFRKMTSELEETLLLLSTGHLFGLDNPNQVADALSIPKAKLYRCLKDFSLYQWQRLLVRIGCSIAVQEIRDTESKSASTQSRRRPTISVDGTNDQRYGKLLSYCFSWWSKKDNRAVRCRNILAITLKIGDIIIPLSLRIVSKQGRGSTDKPSLFVIMLKEVLSFFETEGIDIRKYPITFDSWSGGKKLTDILSEMGFDIIRIHGKNNYVMDIDNKSTKLSEHKKQIELCPEQWGCPKPYFRTQAISPTFGSLVLLFFLDMGKLRTMLVFGKPLRACEILRIWSQHHGIEHFWQNTRVVLCMT